MKAGLLVTLTVSAAVLAVASGAPRIRPRAGASDYPVRQNGPNMTIGAAVIPAGEVRKLFATNLDSAGYVVIEVGVFPEAGKAVDVSPADFSLRMDANSISERAADAETIAAVATRGERTASSSGSQQPVYGTVGGAIGVGSSIDPATGRRTSQGVGSAGGGVGNGGPNAAACRSVICDERTSAPAPPADTQSPERKRASIEQELWEKSLPDGGTTKAVAGYLYFPKPSSVKAKNATWILQWDGAAGRVSVEIPPSARR